MFKINYSQLIQYEILEKLVTHKASIKRGNKAPVNMNKKIFVFRSFDGFGCPFS